MGFGKADILVISLGRPAYTPSRLNLYPLLGEGLGMWWKLLIGGIIGLGIGHYVIPGYWLWVIVGLVAGYFSQVWVDKKATGTKKEG